MPVCQRCTELFPNRVMIEGKVRNVQHRRYCIKCSPFGQHNTRPLDQPKKGDRLSCTCGREYIYDKNKGHSLSCCNSCRVIHRRYEVKIRLVKYKGGKCESCGYNKSLTALQFHHMKPEHKDFAIGGNHNRTFDTLKKEVDKCKLLCSNCHAEEHERLEMEKPHIRLYRERLLSN